MCQYKADEKLVSSYWSKFATLRFETMPIYSRKLYQLEMETMSFTEKQHVQIYNNPRLPQCHTEPELLCPSCPPSYFITIYLYPSPGRPQVQSDLAFSKANSSKQKSAKNLQKIVTLRFYLKSILKHQKYSFMAQFDCNQLPKPKCMS